MAECQSSGVESLSRRNLFQQFSRPALGSGDPAAPPATVDRISHHGMAQVGQMDPDLVGPTAMEFQPEKLDYIEPRHHRGIGSGGSTGGGHDHSLPVLLVSAYRGIDLDRASVQMAPRQSGIAAADPAGSDRGAEPAVGDVGLSHNHEARRVPVQPMDNTGSSLRASR
jgi:hypothetical protein